MIGIKSDLKSLHRKTGRLAIIVSRDEALIHYLRDSLNEEDFRVVDIPEYRCIPEIIKNNPYNIILLDMDISLMKGSKLYRLLHNRSGSSVLALVGHKHEDQIKALEAGADDCVTKPLDKVELLAHIHALLRRTQAKPIETPLEERGCIVNDLYIDPRNHQVSLGEIEIDLTLTEFNLLLLLAKKVGIAISRPELLEQIWRSGELESDRTISVHMCRLRKKIEPDPHHPKRLVAVRGIGYKLKG